MGLGLSGAPYGFNYVAADKQSGLNVAASIYDITTGSPVFVVKVPMVEVLLGSYAGVFTPSNGKVYDIISLVYTDPGFTTPDPDRAPGTETVQTYNFPGGSGPSPTPTAKEVIIQANTNLQAIVSSLQLQATVQQDFILQGKVTLQQNIATC